MPLSPNDWFSRSGAPPKSSPRPSRPKPFGRPLASSVARLAASESAASGPSAGPRSIAGGVSTVPGAVAGSPATGGSETESTLSRAAPKAPTIPLERNKPPTLRWSAPWNWPEIHLLGAAAPPSERKAPSARGIPVQPMSSLALPEPTSSMLRKLTATCGSRKFAIEISASPATEAMGADAVAGPVSLPNMYPFQRAAPVRGLLAAGGPNAKRKRPPVGSEDRPRPSPCRKPKKLDPGAPKYPYATALDVPALDERAPATARAKPNQNSPAAMLSPAVGVPEGASTLGSSRVWPKPNPHASAATMAERRTKGVLPDACPCGGRLVEFARPASISSLLAHGSLVPTPSGRGARPPASRRASIRSDWILGLLPRGIGRRRATCETRVWSATPHPLRIPARASVPYTLLR